MNRFSSFLLGAALIAASSTVAAADKAPAEPPVDSPTVVLVHGAFLDDASSWNKLIPVLEAKGIKTVVVDNPLTSLQDDVDATRRVIDAQTGPVVLVGHSWGGTVITEAGANAKVKALVYVAGFAPSAGASSRDDFKDFPAAPGLANPVTTPDGYVTLARQTILTDFVQDVPPKDAVVIAASQAPLRAANYDEHVGTPAWMSKPSWYIVAETDRMFDPDAQRALANKIQANTVSLLSGHVPMLSRPDDVANVIEDAVRSLDVRGVAALSQR
ncbi:alpha/beta hydrolase [Lysobacter sp. A6]|uniref:Alpha/beta hydrolase n=1 Tax=Noviluteimonas lactosilytica TaxID=2888523 RepID=A0ABS8JJQ5_9GAMM|nr:alpha/beta hydrolase [Lysobacter lactosilyticus]MCC8363759.1 alpha/beta hydrolase [Lysobacter lactosilyticus]